MMSPLQIAKIQNTINEIENQLAKESIDSANSTFLLSRSVNQLKHLLTYIGYLEGKIQIIEGQLNDI
jgi:conjugal transfer/entry exclusion protein